jgi:hypothetical protein
VASPAATDLCTVKARKEYTSADAVNPGLMGGDHLGLLGNDALEQHQPLGRRRLGRQ